MFDWLNPNVGTYRFRFDEELFESEAREKIEHIQDQMTTGTAQMKYANTLLADQEGEFVEPCSNGLTSLRLLKKQKHFSFRMQICFMREGSPIPFQTTLNKNMMYTQNWIKKHSLGLWRIFQNLIYGND